MSPSPLPYGESFDTRDDGVRWVEPMLGVPGIPPRPLLAANDATAEPDGALPGVGDVDGPLDRDGLHWVGFGDDAESLEAAAEAAGDRPPRAMPAEFDPRRLRYWPILPFGRLLCYGAAAMAVGVIAAGIYQGGQHLAERAAATPQPLAPPLPAQTPPADTAVRYQTRAEAGEAAAQFDLAVLTARGGSGIPQDLSRAAALFERAALGGNVEAQFNLGAIYERGLGVAPNMAEAVVWYRTAAERDYPAAQYNLATAFAEGRGVPRDFVTAARWYHAAALHHVVPAMVNYAILSERGDGVERSASEAYAWYRAAARRGDTTADARAGELFRQLDGPTKAQAVMAASSVVLALGEAPEGLAPVSAVTVEPAAASAPAGVPAVLRPGGWVGNFGGDGSAGPGLPQPARAPASQRQSLTLRQRQG
jgi:TPR repeat protein